MSSPTKPRTPRLYHASGAAPAFDAGRALAITVGAMLVYYTVAIVTPPVAAIAVAQIAAAGLVLVVARDRKVVGLITPRAVHVVGAALIGMSMWYVNLRLVGWVGDLLHALGREFPEQDTKRLDVFVQSPPLALALLEIAVLPAICEEIVFRGALARGLGSRLPWFVAAPISAVLFSAYHMSLIQAVPTLMLGTVLAIIALRANSTLPAMLAHALNNTAAIVLSRTEFDYIGNWFDRYPNLSVEIAAGLTAVGIVLVVRR